MNKTTHQIALFVYQETTAIACTELPHNDSRLEGYHFVGGAFQSLHQRAWMGTGNFLDGQFFERGRGTYTIPQAKQHLADRGLPMRPAFQPMR